METWAAGILALLGVALGAWLNDFLIGRRARAEERERTFRSALTAVLRARTLARFPYSARGVGTPRGLTTNNLQEFENKVYLESTHRYFVALAEAREQVASLAQYGLNVSPWVDSEDFMQDSLDEIEGTIRRELRAPRRAGR